MAKGKKTGGRKPGTPNKLTQDAREAFRAVYEGRLADLDRWLTETGDGFDVESFDADGEPIKTKVRDPGKAADLLIRMAEHFVPKLARIEKTIADATDEELLREIQRRRAEAEGAA